VSLIVAVGTTVIIEVFVVTSNAIIFQIGAIVMKKEIHADLTSLISTDSQLSFSPLATALSFPFSNVILLFPSFHHMILCSLARLLSIV
jgi:hypothetical protein